MRRLILFAKRAEAGKVKTRLTPPLTAEQAVGLYRGFVADGLEFVRQLKTTTARWSAAPMRPGNRRPASASA